MSTPQTSRLKSLAWFAGGLTCLSAVLFAFLYSGNHGIHPPARGIRQDLAEVLGSAGLTLLILIYARSLIKILLGYPAQLARLIPGSAHDPAVAVLKKVLQLLTRFHRYLGAAAVLIVPAHALLMGVARWNPFLVMVLGLVLWQGLFGLLLVSSRVKSPQLKRYSRSCHAQLFTGVMIAVFAGFGHLLT